MSTPWPQKRWVFLSVPHIKLSEPMLTVFIETALKVGLKQDYTSWQVSQYGSKLLRKAECRGAPGYAFELSDVPYVQSRTTPLQAFKDYYYDEFVAPNPEPRGTVPLGAILDQKPNPDLLWSTSSVNFEDRGTTNVSVAQALVFNSFNAPYGRRAPWDDSMWCNFVVSDYFTQAKCQELVSKILMRNSNNPNSQLQLIGHFETLVERAMAQQITKFRSGYSILVPLWPIAIDRISAFKGSQMTIMNALNAGGAITSMGILVWHYDGLKRLEDQIDSQYALSTQSTHLASGMSRDGQSDSFYGRWPLTQSTTSGTQGPGAPAPPRLSEYPNQHQNQNYGQAMPPQYPPSRPSPPHGSVHGFNRPGPQPPPYNPQGNAQAPPPSHIYSMPPPPSSSAIPQAQPPPFRPTPAQPSSYSPRGYAQAPPPPATYSMPPPPSSLAIPQAQPPPFSPYTPAHSSQFRHQQPPSSLYQNQNQNRAI